ARDVAGYRIERAEASSDYWRTVMSLTQTTSHHDPAGAAGSRYRLFAVNGLGEELLMGEAALLPARALAAWPLPYRGGGLTVSFGAAGGVGSGGSRVEVDLYDLGGRKVRTLAKGSYSQGYHTVAWDGTDGRGEGVAAGVCFLRATTGGQTSRLRLAVLP